VFRLRDDLAIVNTVDFFTPIVDDPYTFGAISAANSLSDVYAMGGVPKTAMNIVCFPRKELDNEILAEILCGGAEKAEEAGVVVVGGHTVDDPELKYGMAVTGIIDPRRVIRNVGATPGDVLVLTKALGIGVIATAHKRLDHAAIQPGGRLDEPYAHAVASMCRLNGPASRAARRAGAHAMTDVTGFGLAGHLHKLLAASGVAASLRLADLPVIPGVRQLIADGFVPGGTHRNLDFVSEALHGGTAAERLLVADPQTSGGLVVSVPREHAGDIPDGVIIGEVVDGPGGSITLV